jgi:methylenetetrahydrofolate reductase (NADPH)
MPATARLPSADTNAETVQRIAAFMDRFSLEATKLSAADIAALQGVVPERTPVYLTAVPSRPAASLIEPARRLRAAGFEPVPHLAVRSIASAGVLDDLLSGLAALAGVRRVLVIAGDRDRPAGPFASAIEVIESGLLQRYGINEVGIAGYPEGHPRISPLVLDRALAAKVEAAAQTGLAVHIVTQFCFDATAVLDWIVRLRELGIEHPVRIGMAGPTDLSTLLRYAHRCGVRASAQGLSRHAGLLKHLVGTSAPDGIIRPLAEAAAGGRLGQVVPHFYSFGGVAATGRWAAAIAAGRVVLDRAQGFGVEPL